MRILLFFKVFLSAVITLVTTYYFVQTTNFYLFGFLAVGVIAIHVTRDRDYNKEPITEAESKLRIESAIIEHLESTEHAYGDCKPCPYSSKEVAHNV